VTGVHSGWSIVAGAVNVRKLIPGIMLLLFMASAFAEDTPLPLYFDPKEPLKTGWLLFLRLAGTYDVFLDDEYQGRTPLLLSNLSPGTSLLTLKSESAIHRRELKVRRHIDNITYYTPRMHPYTGTLSVDSDPPGAAVVLNNIQAGATPLEIENLQSGEYELSLLHPDFMPENRVIVVPRSGKVDLEVALRSCVSLRFEPSLPEGSLVEVYDETGVLIAEGIVEDRLRVPAGCSRIVIRGESFHPEEIEIQTQAQDQELTVPFHPVYYRPKLVFSNLLAGSRVFVGDEDVTEEIEDDILTTVPGSYVVTVATEKYVPFTRKVILTGDDELPLVIANIRDPSLVRRTRRIVVLSSILSGFLLSAGSIVLNLDFVAVPISDSYEDYVTLKYTTLGAAGFGIVLLSAGVVVALLK